VSHGSSNANAIKNAIRVAAECATRGINETIEQGLTRSASQQKPNGDTEYDSGATEDAAGA